MAYVKMATLNRYAHGWSDPMGSFAGAPNMITDKTEPMEPEQSYEDWLMEMIVKYGIGTPTQDIETQWSKLQAASGIGHVVIASAEKMSGIYHVYTFTNKAKRYLDIMNKENE